MQSIRVASLTNPLATVGQLSSSASQLDGVPAELEQDLRYQGCLLTQAAGILLHLPQDIIAQAIVIFTRFFTGPEGGSFREHGIKVSLPFIGYPCFILTKLGFLCRSTLLDGKALHRAANDTRHS